MALPTIVLPSSSVELGGQSVEFRALSRSEAVRLNDYRSDPDEGETFIIACATGVDMDAAREWRRTTDVASVGTLVDAIVELSGLSDPNS